METRRALRARIAELEAALAHERSRSALMDAADLPKCKSIACYNCKNVVYVDIPETGEVFFLGCGKDHECKDFVYKGGAPEWTKDKTVFMALGERRVLLLAKKENPCAAAPRPPCHDGK